MAEPHPLRHREILQDTPDGFSIGITRSNIAYRWPFTLTKRFGLRYTLPVYVPPK